ncbi:MAG: extracellular solute-binding protein [Chlamydiae bacterium]|nr:extracellular solute-binding protein [Chlamydiota bacterium]MBI3277506.1 extracellular solute-binding protein [Chlamydiota bacterium]
MRRFSLLFFFFFLLTWIGDTRPLFAKVEELEVWAMGEEGQKIGPLAKVFEEKYPGVKMIVQAIPWGAAHEKLITAVAGESTPDVCQLGSTWVSEFEAMKVLLPLDSFLEKSSLKADQFFESAWKVNFIQSNLYGIPWYVDTRVLFYRKDLLAKVGFNHAPTTWDELLEVCRKLAKDIDGDGKKDSYGISLPLRDWQQISAFVWQNGGKILSEDGTTSQVNDPRVIEAFQFYQRFFEEGLAPRELAAGTDIFNAFDKGFLPMFISGPWMLRQVHDQVPHLDGKWAVATLPRKERMTSFVGGSSLVIFKNTRHPELAWKWIEFLNQPEIQVKWYQITEDLPSTQAAWRDPYFKDLEMVRVFGEQLKDTESPPSIPEWEEIAGVIDHGMEQVIFGAGTVKECLEKVSNQINKILTHQHPIQSPLFKGTIIGLFIGLVGFFLVLYFVSSKQKSSHDLGAIDFSGRLKRYVKSYAFILPSLTIFIVFLFAPAGMSFLMSFTNWDIRSIVNLHQVSFVGLDNFKNLLMNKIFLHALWNTFVFVLVGGALTTGTALFLAILLNSAVVRFRTFFRVGFFTPVVTTMVAVAVVWRWLYNARFGLINWFLGLIGIEGKNWLGDVTWAMPALILMALWKNFGYYMVIFLAGLQGIPPHLYEASNIDGANRIQAFFYITIPLLKPTLFFISIMVSIGYFQFFAEPYIMTDGGPLDSTTSVVLMMYKEGFKYFHMGYASAIAYILFIVIAAFSWIQFRLNRQNVEY